MLYDSRSIWPWTCTPSSITFPICCPYILHWILPQTVATRGGGGRKNCKTLRNWEVSNLILLNRFFKFNRYIITINCNKIFFFDSHHEWTRRFSALRYFFRLLCPSIRSHERMFCLVYTGCSLTIVFFSENSRKIATSPSPALCCYWSYKKLPAYRSDCTPALRWELWMSLTAM